MLAAGGLALEAEIHLRECRTFTGAPRTDMTEAADSMRSHDEWGMIDPGFVARVTGALDGGEV